MCSGSWKGGWMRELSLLSMAVLSFLILLVKKSENNFLFSADVRVWSRLSECRSSLTADPGVVALSKFFTEMLPAQFINEFCSRTTWLAIDDTIALFTVFFNRLSTRRRFLLASMASWESHLLIALGWRLVPLFSGAILSILAETTVEICSANNYGVLTGAMNNTDRQSVL